MRSTRGIYWPTSWRGDTKYFVKDFDLYVTTDPNPGLPTSAFSGPLIMLGRGGHAVIGT